METARCRPTRSRRDTLKASAVLTLLVTPAVQRVEIVSRHSYSPELQKLYVIIYHALICASLRIFGDLSMKINDLIKDIQGLEEVAVKIQLGKEVGLSDNEVREFVEQYQNWYTDCLAILPDDLKSRFRVEYEGTWYTFKIKSFLEGPTKVSVLHRDEKSTTVIPYWQFPYENSFRVPLLRQKQILLEASKRQATLNSQTTVEKVEMLARRFHLVAHQLQHRHNHRPTLQISDEYDVQDLFHGLLQVYFDDIRPEDTTPSYAGGHTRVDFLLKAEQVVVEIKKTRAGLKAKELRDQLIIDIDCYRAHPDCKTLIAFVYDPDRYIDNAKALETDLSRITDGMLVKVIIVQR